MNIQPQLIELCIKRDRKAEYELYKITFSYLMSICIRYTRNTDRAKEVLNMGFLKILSNLKKYDTTAPFKPWARRIMINTLINEYKKEKVLIQNIQYVEQYYETEDFSEMSTAVSRIDHQQIYHFIEQLPPATQQVFNLYFVDGYKHREIAELLEITEGTSKWHLNSAKEKLKTMLRESNISIKAS